MTASGHWRTVRLSPTASASGSTRSQAERRIFHGGGLPGFDALGSRTCPNEDLAIAVLCNTDGDATMEVADAMAGLVLGAPDAKTRRPSQ